jgi:hypothetical protein
MFLHGSLCLKLQLDVSSSFPSRIGPSRTSKIVKTSSKYIALWFNTKCRNSTLSVYSLRYHGQHTCPPGVFAFALPMLLKQGHPLLPSYLQVFSSTFLPLQDSPSTGIHATLLFLCLLFETADPSSLHLALVFAEGSSSNSF